MNREHPRQSSGRKHSDLLGVPDASSSCLVLKRGIGYPSASKWGAARESSFILHRSTSTIGAFDRAGARGRSRPRAAGRNAVLGAFPARGALDLRRFRLDVRAQQCDLCGGRDRNIPRTGGHGRVARRTTAVPGPGARAWVGRVDPRGFAGVSGARARGSLGAFAAVALAICADAGV
jgi:hypothetical protein